MDSLSDLDYTVYHLLAEYKRLNQDYQSFKKDIVENAESSRLYAATNKISGMCKALFLMKRKLELAVADCKNDLATINDKIEKRQSKLRAAQQKGLSRLPRRKEKKIFTPPSKPNTSFYFQHSTRCKIENSEYEDALQSDYQFCGSVCSKPWSKRDQQKLYHLVRETIIRQQSRQLDYKMCKLYDIIKKTSDDRNINSVQEFYERVSNKKIKIKNSSLANLLSSYPNVETDWKFVSSHFHERFSADECERVWNLVAHPMINHKPWGRIEDLYLKSLVFQHGDQNWEAISESLDTGRTAFLCFVRYSTYFRRPDRKVPKVWTADENALVNEYIERFPNSFNNNFFFSLVTQFSDSVSQRQLKVHVSHVKNSRNKVKGRFSSKEKFLINFYTRKGYSHAKIARKLGQRTVKQVRDFKSNVAEITLNKPWTSREIHKLLLAVKYNGIGRWTEISKYLPHRSSRSCQHKYSLLRSKNPNLVKKSILKVPRLFEIRTLLRNRKTSVDYKIESFYTEYYEKQATPYQGDPVTLAEAVLDILKFLGFDGVPHNVCLAEFGKWLMKFHHPVNHEANMHEQPFDNLFNNFHPTKQNLAHHRRSKFSQILPKSTQVLPPNKNTIYGFDNLKRNFAINFNASNGVNFEELWVDVNSAYEKNPEFIKAKLLLYRTMKALFYWPIKLNTIPVNPNLL